MYSLGSRSLERMEGLHPSLVRVVHRAILITPMDFTVLEGLRTLARQERLFRIEATQTMDSRHLTGHAIDIAPWFDGEVRWDWPLFYPIATAMKNAAVEENVHIRWGGDWNGDGIYDEKFRDGPHYELPRSEYPK